MRVSRVYCPIQIEPLREFELGGKIHHYLSRVLRLKTGHAVHFFNGKGLEFLCTLTQSKQHSSTFICQREVDVLSEPESGIKLYLAVCKNESMDFAVQKATELGIQELQPLISERSVSYTVATKRLSHWQGIVTSACEQCGRVFIPRITKPITMQEVVAIGGGDKAIVCSLSARTSIKTRTDKLLPPLIKQKAMLHLMIGPEGGFNTDEINHVISIGFEPTRLGNYILRSETAVVAALSIVRLVYDALDK